jgi:hypothetical protein
MNYTFERINLTGLFLKEISTKKTDKLLLKLNFAKSLLFLGIENHLGSDIVHVILAPYKIDVYQNLVQCLNLRVKKSILEVNTVKYLFENDLGIFISDETFSSGPIGVFEL